MAKTAVNLLIEQLKAAQGNLEGTLDGISDEVAAFVPPKKANPIAGTYAHLVMSQDFFVHMLLQNKQPLFETTWKDKTGASEIQPTEWQTAYPKWLKEVKVDMEQMNKYQKAVHEATEEYLNGLNDDDLDGDVDMSMFGMDSRKVSYIIGSMILGHMDNIIGEISVLKGIQGLKGYQF